MTATLLAGPLLRRVQARQVALWMATDGPARVRVTLHDADAQERPSRTAVRTLRAGRHLALHLVTVATEADLPTSVWTSYRVWLANVDVESMADDAWADTTEAALCYPGHRAPGFVFAPQVRALLHGSCRKPHHGGDGDGLVRADSHLQQLLQAGAAGSNPAVDPWPSALVLTGDQLYCDDVAGPMLRAIHALGERLGLPDEDLACAEGLALPDAAALRAHPATY